MYKLLRKELKLSASPLSYLFIAFGLMTLLPGYPILVGAFFISFGIFLMSSSAMGWDSRVFSVQYKCRTVFLSFVITLTSFRVSI